jgi:hypothetical protein
LLYVSFYNPVCRATSYILTPGLAGTLATARTPSTAGKPVTARLPVTACSKGTAETPTTPLVSSGASAIAARPATGNHQEFKGRQQQQECLPLSGCKQQLWHQQQATLRMTAISWPLTTAGTQATAGMDHQHIWTPPKAEMLVKQWSQQ